MLQKKRVGVSSSHMKKQRFAPSSHEMKSTESNLMHAKEKKCTISMCAITWLNWNLIRLYLIFGIHLQTHND